MGDAPADHQRRGRRSSLTGRIAAAWRDPVGSYRAERPAEEPRLLAYAFGAALFLTLGRILAEAINPVGVVEVGATGWLAGQIFAGLSFLPLGLYAAAALIGLVCRLCGGAGDWRDTRLAFFWSGLISGPFAALGYAAGAGFGSVSVASALGGLVWIGFLTPMLAAAHGFSMVRVGAVFGALAAASYGLSLA